MVVPALLKTNQYSTILNSNNLKNDGIGSQFLKNILQLKSANKIILKVI